MAIIGPLTGGPGTLAVTGVNGDIYKAAAVSSTLTGDAIGPSNANTVVTLTGQGATIPIGAIGNIIRWAAGTTGSMLTQATATSNIAAQNMTIRSQAPYANATTNTTPGNLIVASPNPVGGNTGTGQILGQVEIQSDGYALLTYGNGGMQFGPTIVTISTGTVFTGLQWLTVDQYSRPYISFTGILPASTTSIVFPAIDGAFWIIEYSNVTTFINGSNKTLAVTAATGIGNSNGLAYIGQTGAGHATTSLIMYVAGNARLHTAVLTG